MIGCKLVLFVLLVITPDSATAVVKSMNRGIESISSALPSHIVDSYYSNQHAVSTIPPPSPKCWTAAWKVFQHVQQQDDQHHHQQQDAQTWCSVMPEEHQKVLALEIARCHLVDLGKPLIRDRAVLNQCLLAHKDVNVLQMCLKRLTDAGANAYTHYISHVQQLCTRLTAEHMVQYQHQVADEMAARYAAVAQQSLEQLDALHDISTRHVAQMSQLSELPAQLADQLSVMLQHQLQETVQDELRLQLQLHLRQQLQEGLGELLQRQAVEQASHVDHIMTHMEARDTEHQQVYESWTAYQTTLWQNQAREMERQRTSMMELSEVVSTTAQSMQPLVGLKSLVTAATHGYGWITFLLHFLGTFNLVWLFTRPQRCHHFRVNLFGIVLTEAVFELALKAACDNDLLSAGDYTLAIDKLRRWAMLLECVAYLAGLVFSCFAVVGGGDRASISAKGDTVADYGSTRHDLNPMVPPVAKQCLISEREATSTVHALAARNFTEHARSHGHDGDYGAPATLHSTLSRRQATPYSRHFDFEPASRSRDPMNDSPSHYEHSTPPPFFGEAAQVYSLPPRGLASRQRERSFTHDEFAAATSFYDAVETKEEAPVLVNPTRASVTLQQQQQQQEESLSVAVTHNPRKRELPASFGNDYGNGKKNQDDDDEGEEESPTKKGRSSD